MFKSVHNDSRIKALSYINVDWNAQAQWIGQGWGDSRVQFNELVFQSWKEEVSGEAWIMASDSLFELMQLGLWNDSLMTDTKKVLASPQVNTSSKYVISKDADNVIQLRSISSDRIAVSVYDISGIHIYESFVSSNHHSIPMGNIKGVVIFQIIIDNHVFRHKVLAR